MTTPFQAQANRANSQCSTGPRTETGKARSSQNALKHGMEAQTPLLPGESPERWRDHREGVLMALGAKGSLETALADRLALTLWRLQRIAACEAAAATDELPADGGPTEDGGLLSKVMRYEAHVSRQMLQALQALDRLQIIRDRMPALLTFLVEDTMETFDRMVKTREAAKKRREAAEKDNECQ
jgi:hypothetical protein